MSIYHNVASLLIDIEAELRRLDLWDTEPPAEEALQSTEPFCIDTLDFHQWLQFVFLPRMYWIVEECGDLPPNCAIAPMAEEVYREADFAVHALIARLWEIDRLLTVQ